jgi:tellurite resistance protein
MPRHRTDETKMSAEHVEAAFEAMQGADLTPAAKLLLVAYALHLSPDGTPTKSWRKLEKVCGVKRPTTVAAAKTLKDLGFLDVVKKSNHPGSKIEPLDGSKIEPHWLKNLTTEDQPLARVLINNKEINNTHTTCACACEGLADFCAHYPKRTFANAAAVRSAWEGCLAEGITAAELMRCLELAKMSKAWQEQDGRYIPKAHVWLHERRFDADLQRIRAERQLRDDTRRREREAEEMNALIYGGWDEEE